MCNSQSQHKKEKKINPQSSLTNLKKSLFDFTWNLNAPQLSKMWPEAKDTLVNIPFSPNASN